MHGVTNSSGMKYYKTFKNLRAASRNYQLDEEIVKK